MFNKLKNALKKTTTPMSSQLPTTIGSQKEMQAERYLSQQGLLLAERNFRCRLGEIDLIMHDQDYLVFVEVRFRSNAHYGRAAETIDKHKQEKLQRAAQYYLQERHLTDTQACRFDTLCIQGAGATQEFEWVKNALA